jgi:hypothetical protein
MSDTYISVTDTDNLDLMPLQLNEVFKSAYVCKHYAYRQMGEFIEHHKDIYNPWSVLSPADISKLKNFMGAYYPTYGIVSNYDPRFKP